MAIIWVNKVNQALNLGQLQVLVNSMVTRTTLTIEVNGIHHTGVINSIEAEDGSGHCFNIGIQTSKGLVKVYADLGIKQIV